jgi:hypothetical protein
MPSKRPRTSRDRRSPSPSDPFLLQGRRSRQDSQRVTKDAWRASPLPMRQRSHKLYCRIFCSFWLLQTGAALVTAPRVPAQIWTPYQTQARVGSRPLQRPAAAPFLVLMAAFGTGIDRTIRCCAVVRALSHRNPEGPLQDPVPSGSDGGSICASLAVNSRLGPLCYTTPTPLLASSLGR